jgi:hypothetical protein
LKGLHSPIAFVQLVIRKVFMKIRILAAVAAALASVTVSRADITNTTLWAYNDGVMYCSFSPLTQIASHEFQLSAYGDHLTFATGRIRGNILTDTETDPALNLLHSIDNDTGFTWTDYHLKITLNKTFSLSAVTVDNGWTFLITPPTQVGSDWIGYIDYYAGTPILNGSALNFGYTMTFVGSVSFSEELTPTSVPEPGALALLACGLMALSVLRRRFAA